MNSQKRLLFLLLIVLAFLISTDVAASQDQASKSLGMDSNRGGSHSYGYRRLGEYVRISHPPAPAPSPSPSPSPAPAPAPGTGSPRCCTAGRPPLTCC
ncbi:hypothetical protein ACS0TY_017343 [Phlomoides rotata]